MKIKGAVLDQAHNRQPYRDSQPLKIQELDLDQPGGDEVLVRNKASGLCHSDLSVINGDRPRPLPILLGHETSGIVEQLGPGVQDFEIGDHVVMSFLPRCQQCDACQSGSKQPCTRGTQSNNDGVLLSGNRRLSRNGQPVNHHLGVSGFASHSVVSRHSLTRVGKDIPFDIAALFGCALLTGGGAILNEVRPEPSTSVAIVGLGGVGMSAMMVARAVGVRNVTAIDPNPGKLAVAQKLGAQQASTPEDISLNNQKFDAVIEAAGHPSALESAFDMTSPGGLTVTVGLPHPDAVVHFNALTFTGQARRLHGSYLGSSIPGRDIPRYETLWREGKLPIEKLISNRIYLNEVNDAMDNLASGSALRQMILFD